MPESSHTSRSGRAGKLHSLQEVRRATSLKGLALKASYDSDEDNILEDFYVPVLSSATKYDRLAGYFSSSILGTAAQGMARFIQNGGRMRLVTCVHISEQDLRAINDGSTNPEEVLSRAILSKLDVKDQLEQDHVAALAGMVARGDLEIKFAVPYSEDHGFAQIDGNSIYHQKIGVLYNGADNMISFSGSINETGKAWGGNIEEFKVFCRWKPGQDAYCDSDAKKFEKFWHNRSKNTKVFDLPSAVRDRLIAIAPEQDTAGTGRPLRYYQKDAIDSWLENDKHGILEMATGTGKTLTAIKCIKKILDESKDRNLIVITCPLIHLVAQWADELKKWDIKSRQVYGSFASWKRDLGNGIHRLNSGAREYLVVVTTHATFSGKKFIQIIALSKVKNTIIADEVHRMGAEKTREGMLDSYEYRLGLSATPERYFDDEGTKDIIEFFGGVVFKYGIDRAISDGFLTHYLLYPHVVYMNSDETDRYHGYSKALAVEQSKEQPDPERIKNLSIKRSSIVKSSVNKLVKFKEIMQSNRLDHCLVYCADMNQLDATNKVLHEAGVMFHRFTSEEDMRERKKLLHEFDKGDVDALLAIKCLDEGVDVPSTKTAIILASSQNPIEYVQRRGRILRRSDGKDHAVIHDMIVLPQSLPEDESYTDSEKKMIKSELRRLWEFARSSDNPGCSQNLIRDVSEKYGLDAK